MPVRSMYNCRALPAAACLTVACLAADAPSVRPTALPDLAARGRQTLGLIERRFAARGRDAGQYLDDIRPADPKFVPHVCYMWACGVQLSALVSAATLDPRQGRPAMLRYVKALDQYWFVDANGLGGYNASIRPKSADRYYDDNAWIALDLCEAYALTGDKALLDRARKTFAFMLSGEDDRLGGGLYWHEQKKEGKNTCINAPAAACALRLYRLTGEKRYLDAAARLYAWTKTHLQDPDDGLYYDNVKLDGKVDKTKFSYNTALMIRAACLFYDQTGDRAYLAEAQRLAKASEAKWIGTDGDAVVAHGPGYFAHLLIEALLDVDDRAGDRHYHDLAARLCDTLWLKGRDPNGLYAEHWDAHPGNKPLEKAGLLWQASCARLFLHLAARG